MTPTLVDLLIIAVACQILPCFISLYLLSSFQNTLTHHTPALTQMYQALLAYLPPGVGPRATRTPPNPHWADPEG